MHCSFNHSHKKREDILETQAVLLNLNLKYLGWSYRAYIKTAKNGHFCEELLSENDFKAVLATFCCCDHGSKASEAVQKIATDEKEYRKEQKEYRVLLKKSIEKEYQKRVLSIAPRVL